MSRPFCEIGERVLFLLLKDVRKGGYEPRFLYCVYLGIKSHSGEPLLGTATGVVEAAPIVKFLMCPPRKASDF